MTAAIVLVLAACVEPMRMPQAADSVQIFADRMQRALDARDPHDIAALADVAAWREASHPPVEELELVLPPGPLVREGGETAAANEIIYRDASSPHPRRWRMRLRRTADGDYRAGIIPEPCPTRSRSRGFLGEHARPGDDAEPRTWTVLECYPLPS